MRLILLTCLCVLMSIASPSPLPSTDTLLKRCPNKPHLTVVESSGSLYSLFSAQSLTRSVQRWKSWLTHSPSGSRSPTQQSIEDQHEKSATVLDTAVVKITIESSSSHKLAAPKLLKPTKDDASQTHTIDKGVAASQKMELEKQAYLKRSLSHVLERSKYLQQQDTHQH